MRKHIIYPACMVVFPLLVMVFFTSLMEDGLPTEMPIGIVDVDNTTTTRALIRRLDAFQMSRITHSYATVAEARKAIQNNEIYGFLYFPKGTTERLLASRQPKISYYYSYTTLAAGALLMRDLKTISTLGSAAVGQATMRAKGFTPEQIQTFLQPIAIDLHAIANPWMDYNMYLSTMLVPGIIMLFIFLITAYSLGTEMKFGTSKEWLSMADGNIYIALAGKFLPQFLLYLSIMLGYEYYVHGVLHFNHLGTNVSILLNTVMAVVASQGFGIFAFGLTPSLRMSMSICSLWAVLSFTIAGTAFPLSAMDSPIQALSWLFPLRHYYMIYQICVLNGFPLSYALLHFGSLALFVVLPWFFVGNIRRAMLEYEYIP